MSYGHTDRIRAWRAMMHIHATVINAIDQTLREEVGIPGAWYEALVEISLSGGAMRMNEFAEETTLTRSGATSPIASRGPVSSSGARVPVTAVGGSWR